jgi:hypothetical protein
MIITTSRKKQLVRSKFLSILNLLGAITQNTETALAFIKSEYVYPYTQKRQYNVLAKDEPVFLRTDNVVIGASLVRFDKEKGFIHIPDKIYLEAHSYDIFRKKIGEIVPHDAEKETIRSLRSGSMFLFFSKH